MNPQREIGNLVCRMGLHSKPVFTSPEKKGIEGVGSSHSSISFPSDLGIPVIDIDRKIRVQTMNLRSEVRTRQRKIAGFERLGKLRRWKKPVKIRTRTAVFQRAERSVIAVLSLAQRSLAGRRTASKKRARKKNK